MLADRTLDAQLPLGHVGAERAVGLVELGERALVHGDGQLGRRDLEGDGAARGADAARDRHEHDDLALSRARRARWGRGRRRARPARHRLQAARA